MRVLRALPLALVALAALAFSPSALANQARSVAPQGRNPSAPQPWHLKAKSSGASKPPGLRPEVTCPHGVCPCRSWSEMTGREAEHGRGGQGEGGRGGSRERGSEEERELRELGAVDISHLVRRS
mmetsp:Transcript_32374/g.50446  ORF Transcript_32374/g.50446 Transcript_32374/m.50446 type:complete len:125 (+) Transcript_32374:243-617(+)